MCIKSYAIIRVSHKYIFNLYIFATHKVNAIAPSLATERFQVINLQSVYFSSQYGIMIRIDNCNTIYLYILTMRKLKSTYRIINISPAYKSYIFNIITDKLSIHNCPGSQINSSIGRYSKCISRQIFWTVKSGSKIDHSRIIWIGHFCLWFVSEYMQVVYSIFINLYRELSGFIQREINHIFTYCILNSF